MDFVNATLFQLQSAARLPNCGVSEIAVNSALAMIESEQPRNETEGAIVIQMACVHSATMTVLGRLSEAYVIAQCLGSGDSGESADPKLANAARAQLLPPAWSALYELTKLPEETFAKAASTGAIHPKMTRDDVRTMVGKLPTFNVTHETRPMVAAPLESPLQITSDKTKPQAEMVNLSVYTAGNKLQQIKKLVAELAADVRRGDAALPASFETQIRILAGDLMSLVSQRGMVAIN